MANRPLWRGHLKLSLVSCPVALYSTLTGKEEMRLHFINPKTGHRIRQRYIDAETEKPVERQDLIRGYEFSKDRYVTFSEEELDDIKIESSTNMVVDKFIDAADIPPMYYDSFYYMAPDGDAGDEAFAVIRDAMERAGKCAIARVVLMRKERVIAFMPRGKGMVAFSLHEAGDVKPEREFFKDIGAVKADKDMLAVAQKLIAQKSGKFDAADFEDRYAVKLRALVDAKLKGVEIEEEPEEAPQNVINLMDALKRSLGQQRNPRGEGSATVHRLKPRAKTPAAGKAVPRSSAKRKAKPGRRAS